MTTEFSTPNFPLACFLRAKGILYIRIEWPTPEQAIFVFAKPPDDLLISWQMAKDSVSARALVDAQNFFRDELRKR